MIDGYIQGGCFMEALEIFHQMQRQKIRPRKFVRHSVLYACANLGALDQGIWIHTCAKRNSIGLDGVLVLPWWECMQNSGQSTLHVRCLRTLKTFTAYLFIVFLKQFSFLKNNEN